MMNQNVMRDPLRAGMEARAHGLPKLLLGVAAVLVLVGALVGPLLRTLAVVFMLRLSAALLEPIADGDIVCAIGDFSRTVVLFFITMLCVGTMYFLLIVQVLLVGNLTVLLR